jgi:RNA polymerase sigma-70 factor (ECF subfamily)
MHDNGSLRVGDGDPDRVDWVADLQPDAVGRDRTLAALRGLLLRVARNEAARRGSRLRIGARELDELALQAAADALVAILAELERFRGESRFETWAYKFVVVEVARRTAHLAWRRSVPRGDRQAGRGEEDRFGVTPGQAPQWRERGEELQRLVDEELSARQRSVFVAIVRDEMPIDVLAARGQTSRGAIYDTLLEARRKLRARLVANGDVDGIESPPHDG